MSYSYKKALEEIKEDCGQVCKEYETCEHPACQSSYNSWVIADKALTEGRSIEKYKWLIIWVIGMFMFITIVFTALTLTEIHHNKKLISKLENRIVEIEKYKTDYDRTKVEFITFKELTSKEFEKTWRSFGAVRANFLALGTGKHLQKLDIAPKSEYKE